VEFWQTFSARIFLEQQQRRAPTHNLGTSPLMLDGSAGGGVSAAPDNSAARAKQYSSILTEVRRVLISKMAKPPEVTIKENEEGHIVRAEEEDTDEIALYKMMREALIYLTHLNASNMESIMLQRLTQECLTEGTAEHWSPTLLNRLCWAIGSISGAMQESDEKRFLVSVIKDLLSLCEMKRGKENKAVVASNIMYVVGQYPRFLRAHWKFLKTVVFKLFEFMHETFPGVQEMAVDTFLKICQKCKRKFVQIQQSEQMPFVEEMMSHIAQDISELEHLHICTYFEAVGHMISAAAPESKERLVTQLMHLFNEKWSILLRSLQTATSFEFLQDQQVLRDISLILRVNERMVSAVGAACHTQLANIYVDMLKIYKVCSDFISHSTAQQGAQVMVYSHVRLMRNVKRDTLRLVQTFIDTSAEQGAAELGLTVQSIAQRFIPPLLEPVLADYRSNLPQARDAEVLDLLATLATRLSDAISQEVSKIFEMVFECTCDMIKGDFHSYPDHRTKFYDLLKAINSHCFQALFFLQEVQLKLYVDSLIWAAKHEQPQVADSGLQILAQFLERLLSGSPQVYVPFFKQYYFILIQDVLGVLTDTFHKSGFKLQQHVLMQLVSAVENGLLADAAPKQRVMEFLFDLITKSFPTLHRSQAEIFVLNCFNKARQPNEFQQHLRDFLIQLREWGSHEEALYEEERQAALNQAQAAESQWRMQVPGLVPQYDPSRALPGGDMDDI
jgi:exportin-1